MQNIIKHHETVSILTESTILDKCIKLEAKFLESGLSDFYEDALYVWSLDKPLVEMVLNFNIDRMYRYYRVLMRGRLLVEFLL